MERWRAFERTVVVAIVVISLAAGPIVPVVDVISRDPSTLGDGTATASVTSLPTDGFRIDDGRFGTSVRYLRIPDAVVTVGAVRGHPRIVYRVEVPTLDVDRSATRVVGPDALGPLRLDGVDRAFERNAITDDSYRGTVSVRVQSFEVNDVIYRRNVTVEVDS